MLYTNLKKEVIIKTKELRKQAIKRYKKNESPKKIY